MSKGIIYYCDDRLDPKVAVPVREQIKSIGLPITSCTLIPLPDMGKNIYVQFDRGYLAMFRQILTCLQNAEEDIIFFCEHDVLYHPSHFEFTPPDNNWYYNHNWWKVGRQNELAVHWDADQVSGICVDRKTALRYYEDRVRNFDKNNFDRKFEPQSGHGSKAWKSPYPNIDIRHNSNLTKHKWSLDDFRNKASAVNFEETTIDKIPGWNKADILALV